MNLLPTRLFKDPTIPDLIDREAGSWREEGADWYLSVLLHQREKAIQQIADQGGVPYADPEIYADFLELEIEIDWRKIDTGLTEVPPREDTPGAPE